MKRITSIPQTEIKEQWYIVDAEGKRIGLVASKVAELLMGKNNVKMRNYHAPKNKVIVINAAKIDITPKRGMTKFYKNYSGFPGGLRFRSLEDVMKSTPTRPITDAVKGMLPRTKRGDEMIANLKVFTEASHDHEAQQPEKIDLNTIKL